MNPPQPDPKKQHPKFWFCYIIENCDKTRLYTGVTTCLIRRLQEHNGLREGGAANTTAGRPWRLVYSKRFTSQSDALRHEIKMKDLSREQKLRIIEAEKAVIS